MDKIEFSRMISKMTKERPRCRRYIIEQGLQPYPSVDEWDGTAFSRDGSHAFLTPGLKKQMRIMIAEGYFIPAGK